MPGTMLKKLKSMIKSARVVSSDDTGDYPVIEVTYFGVFRTRILLISSYGIWGRAPDGSLATVFNINAVESNQGAIANDYVGRPVKNKAGGEVVIGNSITGTHILFREDGGMDIRAFGSVDLVADGDVTVTAPTINITATDEINLTAPEINLTGANLKHNGVNIGDTHTHLILGGSSSPGPTGGPQ